MTITVAVNETDDTAAAPAHVAATGRLRAVEATAGSALDAMVAQDEDDDNSATLVIVQRFRPDRFWPAERQARFADLMERWKAARDHGATPLSAVEKAELDALVLAQTEVAGKRAVATLKVAKAMREMQA